MNPQLPAIETLRALLDYDATTGEFTWKAKEVARPHDLGWNKRRAGKRAFTQVDHTTGYRKGMVGGVKMLAHRVAFAIYHGRWPANDIDHINGDRRDNRIDNLRDVPRIRNARNRGFDARCSSGVVGVGFYKGRWRASIGRGLGVSTYIGQYDTMEEAVLARKREEARLGYTFTDIIVGGPV